MAGQGTHSAARASVPMTNRRIPEPLPADTIARLDRLDRLAGNLDSRYRIPLTNIRFGWDAVLGILPGIGDIAALAPGAYILLEAHQMGVPGSVKARMVANTGIDLLVGSIPLIGSIFDVGFRSNRRNVALIREHFGMPDAPRDGVPA